MIGLILTSDTPELSYKKWKRLRFLQTNQSLVNEFFLKSIYLEKLAFYKVLDQHFYYVTYSKLILFTDCLFISLFFPPCIQDIRENSFP